jgi:inorganic pyrophosphatase
MIDQNSEDEKILAVGVNNPIYKNLNEYRELYPHLLLEIEHFFSVYKELEAKRTRVKGWEDAARAREMVTESQQRYRDKQG